MTTSSFYFPLSKLQDILNRQPIFFFILNTVSALIQWHKPVVLKGLHQTTSSLSYWHCIMRHSHCLYFVKSTGTMEPFTYSHPHPSTQCAGWFSKANWSLTDLACSTSCLNASKFKPPIELTWLHSDHRHTVTRLPSFTHNHIHYIADT